MGDRLQFLAGIVIGCIGLIMLVQLDVPVIRHGGFTAGLATLELCTALALLSVAVALHAKEG